MNLFDGLVDGKTLRVLTLFLSNPGELYHINKVSEKTGVPLATTFRIMNSLRDYGIIDCEKISKFKIYRLSSNDKTKKLRGLI